MPKIPIALFLITFLTATGAAAQVNDTSCAVYKRPIFYYAETGAHFTGSLDDYFKKVLPVKTESREGAFKIKLVIDSVGRPDCLSIQYNTTSYTPEEIRSCIDSMPGWLPARQNGHPVTFSAMIVVTVSGDKRTVSYLNEFAPKRR
jgi:hypothetical protein